MLEEHIQNYMQDNFQIETGIMYAVKIRDLLELNTEYVTIMEASGAADLSGMVLERKAVDYMLDRYDTGFSKRFAVHQQQWSRKDF